MNHFRIQTLVPSRRPCAVTTSVRWQCYHATSDFVRVQRVARSYLFTEGLAFLLHVTLGIEVVLLEQPDVSP